MHAPMHSTESALCFLASPSWRHAEVGRGGARAEQVSSEMEAGLPTYFAQQAIGHKIRDSGGTWEEETAQWGGRG